MVGMTDQDKIERIMMSTVRTEEGIKNLERRFDDFESKLEKDYVLRTSYEPVQKIVYGLVGVILMAFITALAAIVINGGA
jgi:tetrahydromethanopterin S-methyltransferase subunit B